MGGLDVVQVYRALADRRRRRRETYACILRTCEKHIQNVAARDGMRCVFAVPEFRVGLPTFDINECTRFVRTELEKAGFVVRYFFPNILHISWDVADIERAQQQQQQSQNPDGGAAVAAATTSTAMTTTRPALPQAPRRERGGGGRFFLELE